MGGRRTEPALRLIGVSKSFVLHERDGARLDVLTDFDLQLHPGEVVALTGPSGAGKSSVLHLIDGSYRATAGQVLLRDGADWVDLAAAGPSVVAQARRRLVSLADQFLRAIPRVPAEEVVAEPMRRLGATEAVALDRARELLTRLAVPEALWRLPPMTFSGGQKQRVNLARALCPGKPLLLLDEPTASLDAGNVQRARQLIAEAAADGAAILLTCHDDALRRDLADREVSLAVMDAAL